VSGYSNGFSRHHILISQCRENFQSVAIRQREVQQHHIGLCFRHGQYRRPDIRRDVHVVPELFEQEAECARRQLAVLNY